MSDTPNSVQPKLPDVSIVVPVYDEVDNLRPLVEAVAAAMVDLHYELILVNDGSKDGSARMLDALAAEDSRRPSRSRLRCWRRSPPAFAPRVRR